MQRLDLFYGILTFSRKFYQTDVICTNPFGCTGLPPTMSTAAALQTRLKELSATLVQIQPLVDRLRNFTASIGQGDEARLELGAEIHSQLKDAESELELLRGDIEALDTGSEGRRKSTVNGGEKEAEKERAGAMAGRLADDLKRYAFWTAGDGCLRSWKCLVLMA